MTRRLLAALLALLLAASACSGDDAEDVAETAGDDTADEALLVRRIHEEWARNAHDALSAAWTWCGTTGRVDSSQWPESGTILVWPGSETSDDRYATVFRFGAGKPPVWGYDASQTTIEIGVAHTVTTPADVPGQSFVFDLRGVSQDGAFKSTESVTLHQERSVTITRGVKFSGGTSVEVKGGGTIAGVGLETTVSATFGYENSSEKQLAEAESKDTQVTHEFDAGLPAGEITHVSMETSDISSSSPLTVRGIVDGPVSVAVGATCGPQSAAADRWWLLAGSWFLHPDNARIWDCWRGNPHAADRSTGMPHLESGKATSDWWNWTTSHPCVWTTTIGGLLTILRGQDASWQGMNASRHSGSQGSGWLDGPGAGPPRQSAEKTAAPALRSVEIDGAQHRQFQRGTTTRVNQITPKQSEAILNGGGTLCAADGTCPTS